MFTLDRSWSESVLLVGVGVGKNLIDCNSRLRLCPKVGTDSDRGGELGVLRVREHPLSMKVHPLTTKSTPSK